MHVISFKVWELYYILFQVQNKDWYLVEHKQDEDKKYFDMRGANVIMNVMLSGKKNGTI